MAYIPWIGLGAATAAALGTALLSARRCSALYGLIGWPLAAAAAAVLANEAAYLL